MAAIEDLCSRGHNLQVLLFQYPITTVKALCQAADWNKKVAVYLQAQATTIAVSNSLDSAFGKGKSKILDKFYKSLFRQRSKNTDDAAKKILGAFNLPSKEIEDGN